MKLKIITFTIISLLFSKLVTAETAPGFSSWDEVIKAADGGQVNVYMWGGSDAINGFVDDFYGVDHSSLSTESLLICIFVCRYLFRSSGKT